MSDSFLSFLAAAFCVLGFVAALCKDFVTSATALAAANLIGMMRLRNERARNRAAESEAKKQKVNTSSRLE